MSFNGRIAYSEVSFEWDVRPNEWFRHIFHIHSDHFAYKLNNWKEKLKECELKMKKNN